MLNVFFIVVLVTKLPFSFVCFSSLLFPLLFTFGQTLSYSLKPAVVNLKTNINGGINNLTNVRHPNINVFP